jgi:hypothetical protein
MNHSHTTRHNHLTDEPVDKSNISFILSADSCVTDLVSPLIFYLYSILNLCFCYREMIDFVDDIFAIGWRQRCTDRKVPANQRAGLVDQ